MRFDGVSSSDDDLRRLEGAADGRAAVGDFHAGYFNLSTRERQRRELSVVVRDTEGGEKGGGELLSLAVAKLANMTTNELRQVSTIEDVLRPQSRSW